MMAQGKKNDESHDIIYCEELREKEMFKIVSNSPFGDRIGLDYIDLRLTV